MKNLVFLAFILIGFAQIGTAQHIKVVEGKEVLITAKINETKTFEVNLKNTAGKDIQILGIENVHHEIKFKEIEDKALPAREVKTLYFDVTPDNYGVQRLKIMVKYAVGKQRATMSFIIKVDV